MMISTRGRYALRVMVDLAAQNTDRYIPLKEIADRQEISEKYLESILKILVKNGLLEGMRGKGGGYRLTRPPEAYSVGSVLRLTEDGLAPVACLNGEENLCHRRDFCSTLPMWRKLDSLISEFLDSVTLSDLMYSRENPKFAISEDDSGAEA